jgi:HSP20 family protein
MNSNLPAKQVQTRNTTTQNLTKGNQDIKLNSYHKRKTSFFVADNLKKRNFTSLIFVSFFIMILQVKSFVMPALANASRFHAAGKRTKLPTPIATILQHKSTSTSPSKKVKVDKENSPTAISSLDRNRFGWPKSFFDIERDPFFDRDLFFERDPFFPKLDRFFPRNQNLFFSDYDKEIEKVSFQMDVSESDKQYTISADLPGLKLEDIQVSIEDDNLLCIDAERKQDTESHDEDKKFRRKEVFYGKYTRSMKLPNNANTDSINAKFDNGVLHLTIDKLPNNTSTKKEIKVLPGNS